MYTTRLPGRILTCTQFTLVTAHCPVLSCRLVNTNYILSSCIIHFLFMRSSCSCTLQCLHCGPGRELLRFVGTRERKTWTLTAVVIANTVRSAKREGQRSLWISWKGLLNLPSLTLDEWPCGWLESRTGGGSEKGTSHLCLLREDGEIMVWHAILTPVLVLLSLCPASSSSGRHPGQTRGWWLLLPTMAAGEEIQSQKSWGDAKKGEEMLRNVRRFLCVGSVISRADRGQCALDASRFSHLLSFPDPTLSQGETVWWTKSNFLG